MAVFAVCTAGLFPFIHLGRPWMVYYMIPVPTQRTLWPNFQSPLMFDVVAISAATEKEVELIQNAFEMDHTRY